MLSGKVKVTVGENSKILNEGDSVRYNADVKHIIENVSDEESQLYMVVWFAS